MDENVISFTVENTITVGLMALIFFVVVHFIRAQMKGGEA